MIHFTILNGENITLQLIADKIWFSILYGTNPLLKEQKEKLAGINMIGLFIIILVVVIMDKASDEQEKIHST